MRPRRVGGGGEGEEGCTFESAEDGDEDPSVLVAAPECAAVQGWRDAMAPLPLLYGTTASLALAAPAPPPPWAPLPSPRQPMRLVALLLLGCCSRSGSSHLPMSASS